MKRSSVELELFRNLFISIAEEMGAVLRKTSYSANIKERRDYSCAIYDAAAETVAMGDHKSPPEWERQRSGRREAPSH